jgi:hypothetical protein
VRPRHLAAFSLAIAAALVGPGGASASLVPGTPVTVEPGVPDNGRAWELVTPPDPVAAVVHLPNAIAASGNAFFFATLGPLPGASTSDSILRSNISRRGGDGWSTSPVASPDPESEPVLESAGPDAFSSDLSEEIWTNALPPAAPEAPLERGIFRGTGDGHFSLLATGYEAPFRGASADLQHVLLATEKHLLAEDSPRTEGQSVYEVVGSTLRLVDVDSDGLLLSDCGSTVPKENPISSDGRRIFFVTRPSCSGPARAYLREDGLTTTLISASECTLVDCGPEADVTIVGATPSGSSAFLLTEQKLTDDDADATTDLYRYDAAGGQRTLLSAMLGTDLLVTNDPVLASDDGSRALFRAKDPSLGEDTHLYLAGPGGPRLLAPSAGGPLQLSPGGRYALFSTEAQLAEGDTDESFDIYRYDADTGTPTRVSVGPAGGNGAFDVIEDASNSLSAPPRAMSDDGSDVFFNTSERLLAEDRNEVSDVYEWKDGSLGLVSAGSGDRPSDYVGATPDGKSAFFRTTLTLLPLDRDGGDLDFYAARVGGGFPEPTPPTSCQDDSCLPPLNGRIDRAEPASALRSAGGIRLRRLSPGERRRIAATGRIVLLAEAPSSGRLSAQARARVGHRPRAVASTSVEVARAGAVRLVMHLSTEARHALAAGRDLHVQVVLRLAPLRSVGRIGFVLEGGR